jgi:hypothetical protein
MSNTTLKGDRLEFRCAGRFTARAWVAPFAMLNHFRGTSQPAYFADAGNVSAIPFDAELKILVWIKTLRVNRKFSHNY